ncbi:hypothetical protein K9M78_02960 [Candidatus Bipolaricaulota bacterium]|nr:hypothetical protein [Candidatus Bipolaricaulota bacterium]
MGIMDWLSSGKKEEETRDSIVRFLCRLEKNYGSMDDFLEDFYEVINETIEKYNKNNPVRADKLDRDQAYKAGGRWIYEANIQKLDEEGKELEQAKSGFLSRKSTFKVIAREQPGFEIELSGTESLITPFLEEMETVLEEKGFSHEVVTVARPGLGKARQQESETPGQT